MIHSDSQDKLRLYLLKGTSDQMRDNEIEVDKAMMPVVVD